MKYYYFHGYGSSPSACKAEAMREILGAENKYVLLAARLVVYMLFMLPQKQTVKLYF